MSEVRKKLTEFQFLALSELEREVVVLKEQLSKAEQKRLLVVNLVLDAHGVLGKTIGFDQQTQELIISDE